MFTSVLSGCRWQALTRRFQWVKLERLILSLGEPSVITISAGSMGREDPVRETARLEMLGSCTIGVGVEGSGEAFVKWLLRSSGTDGT